MEKIKLEKNYKTTDGYYVTQSKEYEPTDLVPCSLEIDGKPIVSFQSNYIMKGIHV
jgi:hypothetical protein